MSITSYSQTGDGNLVTITVTSDLTGTIYYHWWRDGAYCGHSLVPSMTFYVAHLAHAAVTVVDTNDPAYDYAAATPDVHTATRTLYWTSAEVEPDYYLVEQQQDGGFWTVLARVSSVPGQWEYHYQTDPLDDLSVYSWRITAIAVSGQAGSATTIGPETVVRIPDAPAFSITFDADTDTITITEDT